MATASVSYTFVNGDPNDGAQVSQNFTDLVTFLNNSVVHRDGSTTMTGSLVLPSSDPTSSDQAARKAYVDSLGTQVFATTAARDAAIASPVEGRTVYTSDTDTFWYYNGTAWVSVNKGSAWTAYTPTLTNATVGNGTVAGSYIQQGKLVSFRARFALGSTSTVTGNINLSLPFAAATGSLQLADCILEDAGVSVYPGVAELSGSVASVRATGASGTYATQVQVGPTVPFTWASGDAVNVQGTYEAQ